MEENISKLKSAKENTEKELVEVNKKLKKSVRGLETIRFNPFPDQGSNQSFAVGMLNEEGNGVVFSSLYSRERMSIFAKPVKNGKSEYELTTEEKEVLKKGKSITMEKNEEKSIARPPVVVIMGHIDHGKSTLLDYIRKTNIVDKEVGGITQNISAYEVEIPTPDKSESGHRPQAVGEDNIYRYTWT